jgi:hypothetical protein
LFSAPADTDEAFFAVADLLAPFPEPQTDPPYDNLVATRMAAGAFQDGNVFLSSDIDGQPRGVYFAFTFVPDPGTIGSSFDFASGAVIPNRLTPLTSHAQLWRNGAIVDAAVFDGELPPATGFDGISHVCTVLEDDANFFPPGTTLPGSWEYRTVARDAEGNGWDISAPFQVIPEPSSMALALVLLLCAGLIGYRPCW